MRIPVVGTQRVWSGGALDHTPRLPLCFPSPSPPLPKLPGLPKVLQVLSTCSTTQPQTTTWAPTLVTPSPLLHSFPTQPLLPPSLASLA